MRKKGTKINGRYVYINPKTGEYVSRQRIWQIRKEYEGKCIDCGSSEIYKARLCEKHYKNLRARDAKWRNKREVA